MPKIPYITVISFIVMFSLYGCGSKLNDSINNISQLQQKITENKYIKKYNDLSKSGNIQEELQLNIQGQNDNSIFNLSISSSSYKNIFSGIQNGLYSFQMITEDKTFAETEAISGIIHLISRDKEYFIQPQNITFIGPKGKITNQDIENKISEINNKRIKIDKEIPFTSTSETLISIQTFLNQLYTKQLQINLNNSGNIEIVGVYSDVPINSTSYRNGIFYLSGDEQVQITKFSPRKFGFSFFGNKRKTETDIKLSKTKKTLTIDLRGNISNKEYTETTVENKLDIKGKYIIKTTGHSQLDLPSDYLLFTETSLVKK